jgi:hypothetical protein
MGDGTAANGERVLKRETLELMRTPQNIKQSTDDSIGIAWHLRRMGQSAPRTAARWADTFCCSSSCRNAISWIAILTNSNVGWRPIQDVEREALAYLGATYAVNQGIAHRGLVETLPSVQPLRRQPDPAAYVGTFLRPSNSVVVRADGNKVFVQEHQNNGQSAAEMPISFFGPDRAVVTDGPNRDQAIEFVRDASGRVNWVRVVGRGGANP